MSDVVAGFDWDDGNRRKCQKHGLSVLAFRLADGSQLIRPMSARYMHAKEVKHYEAQS
jgi:uncharacterized DUF497 family protein